MPDNWIAAIKLTDEDAIYDHDGKKIHDLISCEQGDGVEVDENTHHVLWGKLADSEILSVQEIDPLGDMKILTGLCWDGTHFWVCNNNDSIVSQMTLSGEFTGVNFSGSSNITDITWDGEYFYVIDDTYGDVRRYTHDGELLGVFFRSKGSDSAGITWGGDKFYVTDWISNTVSTYSADGTYLESIAYAGTSVSGALGAHFDGTYIWVCAYLSKKVYQFTSSMVYTGVFVDTSEETSPRGFVIVGFDVMISGATNLFYKYTPTALVPSIPRPTNSPVGYKIIADAT